LETSTTDCGLGDGREEGVSDGWSLRPEDKVGEAAGTFLLPFFAFLPHFFWKQLPEQHSAFRLHFVFSFLHTWQV
jgi:hypothetical protein